MRLRARGEEEVETVDMEMAGTWLCGLKNSLFTHAMASRKVGATRSIYPLAVVMSAAEEAGVVEAG